MADNLADVLLAVLAGIDESAGELLRVRGELLPLAVVEAAEQTAKLPKRKRDKLLLPIEPRRAAELVAKQRAEQVAAIRTEAAKLRQLLTPADPPPAVLWRAAGLKPPAPGVGAVVAWPWPAAFEAARPLVKAVGVAHLSGTDGLLLLLGKADPADVADVVWQRLRVARAGLAGWLDGYKPAGGGGGLSGWVTPREIAGQTGLTVGAVRKRLERWRTENVAAKGWKEDSDAHSGDQRFLYLWEAVRHLFGKELAGK